MLDTPDYDEAINQFVRLAVHGLMSDADPIYKSLRRVSLPEGVKGITVDVGASSTASPDVHLSEGLEIRTPDVVEGNLEQFHDALAKIAESYLTQFMRPFFEHVGDAAEAVGNTMTVSLSTLSWDDIIDASERTEWAADATGQVGPPQIVAGSSFIDRLRELPAITPEQKRRMANLYNLKQEEYVSRRSSRRLR